MKALRKRVTSAASWSVAIRLIERIVGFGSTLIFVRLLSPADFGVMAMGTSVLAIVSTFTEFGFSQALIQLKDPDRRAYDTVLTLNVLTGAIVAVVLVLAIPAAQSWYGDERVVTVMFGLAAVSFTASWRSVGLIQRERELDFRPIFNVMMARKLAAVAVGVGFAFLWRDYRALLIGLLAGAAVEVGVSYALAGHRPRLTLARTREVLSFSIWWMLNQAVSVSNQRGRDVLIGMRMGPGPLGQYAVATDLAMLPTNELVVPLTRALFPGYVEMRDELGRLHSAFVRVWAAVALVAVPSAAGIACLAPLITTVILGPQWVGVELLLGPLAAVGAVTALGHTFWPPILVRHGPKLLLVVTIVGTLLVLPAFGIVLWQYDLRTAIIAGALASVVLVVGTGTYVVRSLGGRLRDLLVGLVRPALAGAAMAAGLLPLTTLVPAGAGWGVLFVCLLALVAAGALLYAGACLSLWWLAGRPVSAEQDLLAFVARRLPKRGGRKADASQ
jgi:O-antigen/teichoic acid export membrane protein